MPAPDPGATSDGTEVPASNAKLSAIEAPVLLTTAPPHGATAAVAVQDPTQTPVHQSTPLPTASPRTDSSSEPDLTEQRLRLWHAEQHAAQEAADLERLSRPIVFLGDGDNGSAGFVYKVVQETAYVITDADRIEFMDRIPVISYDGTRRMGDIFSQWNSPVAVVKVCCGEFDSVEFSPDGILKVGDEVATVGYTRGRDALKSEFSGPVESSTVTDVHVGDLGHYNHDYQIVDIDRVFNHVESGLPLFDSEGLVVGIVTEYGGPGSAISADSIRDTLHLLEGLEPKWKPIPTVQWSADDVRRKLMHLGESDYKVGVGLVYKTEGETAYIAASIHSIRLWSKEYWNGGKLKMPVISYNGDRMEGDVFWEGGPVALIRVCCGDFDSLEFSDKEMLEPGEELAGLGYAGGPDNPASYIEATVIYVPVYGEFADYPIAFLDVPSHPG